MVRGKVDTKPEEKSPFEDGIELTLKGTPEMALAVIAKVANELRFQGKRYSFDYDPKCSTETFIEGDILVEGTLATYTTKKYGWVPISVIEIYLLPDNKTLLRIPPRRHWGIPVELSIDTDHSFLIKLLEILYNEFVRLGFVDLRKEKPPIGFRPTHKE